MRCFSSCFTYSEAEGLKCSWFLLSNSLCVNNLRRGFDDYFIAKPFPILLHICKKKSSKRLRCSFNILQRSLVMVKSRLFGKPKKIKTKKRVRLCVQLPVNFSTKLWMCCVHKDLLNGRINNSVFLGKHNRQNSLYCSWGTNNSPTELNFDFFLFLCLF